MVRGFILGAVSGLALSALLLGAGSLLAPQPAGNRPPEAPTTQIPAAAEPPDLAEEQADSTSTEEVAAERLTQPAPLPGLGAPEDRGVPAADTTSGSAPAVGSVDALLSDPDTAASAADVPESEAQVAISPQRPAPRPPAVEAPLDATSAEAPVRNPTPETPALATPENDSEAPSPSEASDTMAPAISPAPLEESAGQEEAAPVPDPPTSPEAALDLSALASPDQDTAPGLADSRPPETMAEPVAPLAPVGMPDLSPDGMGKAEDTGLAPEAIASPTIALQSDSTPRLPGGETGVIIRRPDASDEAQGPEMEDESPVLPPVWQAAAGFASPGDLPLVAVILIDDGSLAQGPDVVAALPFAVTVALDPTLPDAAEMAVRYHEEEIETAALARLPEGANGTDVIVALQASFATIPQGVALVDSGDGGLAASRDSAAAALGWLVTEGRGLAWRADGGDPVARLAATSGAPARAIQRDLDGAGQDAATIRRFLDNAPMRARQDGAVVLLARLRPETVNALMLWAATARAESVALAPLSAVLVLGHELPAAE